MVAGTVFLASYSLHGQSGNIAADVIFLLEILGTLLVLTFASGGVLIALL